VTVSVLTICLAIFGSWSTSTSIEPSNRSSSRRGDTLEIVVPQGDTATIHLGQSLVRLDGARSMANLRDGRLRIASDSPGSDTFRIRSLVGRPRKTVVVHVVPRRRISLALVPVAVVPSAMADSATMGIVNQELSILMEGTGIDLHTTTATPAILPKGPSFWDPTGSGHLDLLRNDDTLRPAPTLDSLVGWMGRIGLVFPKIAIIQTPVRVGWGLGRSAVPGDSLLLLANHTTFPWRDVRGRAIRYVLGNARGQHADTFQVEGYRGDTMRVRTNAPNGRFLFHHDLRTDIVLRPDQPNPPFGLSPTWRVGAAPLVVLPDGQKLEDPRRAARVIAREVCRTLGLAPRDEKSNLMCPVLRMEVQQQFLSPDQILSLHAAIGR
jgi:hypothetical protein